MDYYPVSYWDEKFGQWQDCGRFYRNALVIDFNLVSDAQFKLLARREQEGESAEAVFAAPRHNIDNWIDAPGSSRWSRAGSEMVGIYTNNLLMKDIQFGIDLPSRYDNETPNQKNIIAYESWDGSFTIEDGSKSKLYIKKIWDQPMTLSALFDVYHESINVKDISR
jgi:hypothetical protein